MKTVIISSGSITDYSLCKEILGSAQYIICADGGTRHACNMGIMPDIIMGDLDSSAAEYVEYYREKGVPFKKYSSDKDKTDTELCLEYALEFSREIIMLGATGSRLDHTLANISLLRLGLEKNVPVSIVDSNNQIFMINDSIKLSGKKGELFSLLPISERVEGLFTFGAHYELQNATIKMGSSYGISNYFENDELTITIQKGYLLIFKSID